MKENKIALIGNPNSGKTTLFNLLTNLNQKVGNYPGVTVDKRVGSYYDDFGTKTRVVDLPGVYTLDAQTEDEQVVADFLEDTSSEDYPDLFVVVADASNLERSLLVFTQVYDKKLPVILVLNMVDLSQRSGLEIDAAKLQSLLANTPVVELEAKRGWNLAALKKAIATFEQPQGWQPFIFHKMEGHEETQERYRKIQKLLKFCINQKEQGSRFTERLDRILTHPLGGYLIFIFVLFLLFQLVYEVANLPMDLIDWGFTSFSTYLRTVLPAGILSNLLVEGIIPGVGGVLIFIPQIALLFLFLLLLEESGYMTRVVFIMDRLMRPFGLHGKSVVPMISGMACAVPAIMAARTIDQPKDRLITIMVTPLMSCSARLPVYALMIALVIPNMSLWGIFNLQGLVLLAMYFLGLLAALFAGFIFKMFIQPKAQSFLMMEMPSYKMPRITSVINSLYQKIKVFVLETGKIILSIAVLLWVLGSYGPGSFRFGAPGKKVVEEVELAESFIGKIGKQIEPAIEPLGYDWRIGIALITSFAAREVFVGTMATIYNVDEAQEGGDSLLQMLKNARDPDTGKKIFDLATGLSLMVFYAFAMQCMSTLAVVKRETKSWKWPLIQLTYMTLMAYFGSLLTFLIAS